MWVRYYLSALKYRMAEAKKADIEGLPNMLQDLRVVLEWYPERADAYDMMAVARMEGGGQIAAMQAERAAIQLSPRNQRYLYHLAEIYESDKKWDAARALLNSLKTSENAQVAADARERLGRLTTNQKYGCLDEAASDTEIVGAEFSFDVLEQDAAKRAAEQAAHGGHGRHAPGKVFSRTAGRRRLFAVSRCSAHCYGVDRLKLRTSDYKSLLLIGADTFSCEWNNRSVSVNYRPGGFLTGICCRSRCGNPAIASTFSFGVSPPGSKTFGGAG